MAAAEGALACPFCGSDDIWWDEPDVINDEVWHKVFCNGKFSDGTPCFASGLSTELALQLWNRRAHGTPRDAAIAVARDVGVFVARIVVSDLRKQIAANLDVRIDERMVKAFNWELDYYVERIETWCDDGV